MKSEVSTQIASNKEQVLRWCENLAQFGLFSFVLFLPASIAFSQISLGFILLAYVVEAITTRRLRFMKSPLDLPILLFVLVTLVSTLFSVNVSKSLKVFLPSLFPLSVFYLVFYYLKDLKTIKKLITLLLIIATLNAVYGIAQHFWRIDWFRLSGHKNYLRPVNDLPGADIRIPGTFSISMTFAGQLIMVLSLIWSFILFDRSHKNKFPLIVSATCIFFALIWTYTRSAWLGFGVALLFLGYVKGRKSLLKLTVGILICVLLIFLFQPSVLQRAESMFSFEQNMDRIYIWKSSLDMIKDHPITGIGQGNYNKLSREYQKSYPFKDPPSHAHSHNDLIMITVDRGILGLLAFIWLWITIFKQTGVTLRQIPQDHYYLRALILGCLASFIAFFVEGFFENNFGDSEVAMMLWFLVATVMVVKEKIISHLTSSPIQMEELVLEEKRMVGVLTFAILIIMAVMVILHL
jgi:O-antigen ligase